MRTLSALSVATAMALAVLVPTGIALASCAMDERSLEQQVAESQVVFVGTVVGLEDQQRTALFDVQEVWKGPDIPGQVAVRGGPGEPNMATSVDRSWRPGQRYLVMPYVEGGRLADNSCSPTRPWEDELAQARPDEVRRPTSAGADDGGAATASSTPWIVGAVVAVALVGGVGYVLTGRRR